MKPTFPNRKTLIRKFAPPSVALSMLMAPLGAAQAQDQDDYFYEWTEVSGTAIHYFSTALSHSEGPTPRGMVQYTTDTIELFGDVEGRVLYQPVTRIFFDTNTLVNRGNQVFSGTVLGIGPVMLHDDQFRFEVNMETGETNGKVWLNNRIAGPLIRCRLDIVGTGFTEAGDGLAEYSGRCRMFREPAPANSWQ
ncbi:MAG: hypothetical protein AAGH19_06280 [Pseudomonadota bacterium]